MSQTELRRREFLKGAGVVGAASASTLAITAPVPAQTAVLAAAPTAVEPAGYAYLKPAEAEFVEALVDHMVPADELTGRGTEIGIATFIDRTLAGSWGKGDRLYMQGPWLPGTPNQGYQLPLTPAELYRAGIQGADDHCRKAYGKSFAKCAAEQKEAFLQDLAAGEMMLAGGLAGRAFFAILYQNVMEGMFADPIYGGNKDKAGWKMIGFPGVLANNAENVKTYGDGRRFVADPVSISDLS
jgi:gluconate 2-dehydrogenase gamma chain